MAEKQLSESIYNRIMKAYGECASVQAISLALGVSKMTVQRVLITEGLWESKRSREIVELAKQGKTADEIAKELVLSLKCVQNYMPYKRGMRQECVTVNAQIAKQKRGRMKKALEGQRGKFASPSITDRIQMDKNMMRKEREQFENMMKNVDKLFDKESRPDTSVKKYIPSVLKLRFELVNEDGSCLSLSREDKAVLGKYAKMKDGFIREAIVPSGISLNALNYMIQRLYGWQNSHLHRFTLTKDTFNAITEQGDINAWERLCGVMFRFPNEDYADQYCADDYDGMQSFKTWLKNKYSGAELPFSVGDTYLDNQLQVEAFEKNRQNNANMRSAVTLNELIQAVDLGGDGEDLVERLSLLELLCPEYVTVFIDKWISNISAEIQNKQAMMVRCEGLGGEYMELLDSISELRKRRITQAEMERIISDGFRLTGIPKSPVEQVYVDNKKEIDYLSSNCRKILSAFEPKILPLTDTLLYHYDFGDGWCVKITCLDGYYINDSWDYPNEDGVVLGIADDNQAIKDWEFFDCREHKKIKGEYAELLRNVASKNVPACVYSDGLTLLDDVGGIGGFVEMLKTLHSNNQEEADSMREWANNQGWFGRSVKVENML